MKPKPPCIYPRGPNGIFHVRYKNTNGKWTWRSTHTSDRAKAEQFSRGLTISADMIGALLPDEVTRSALQKYFARYPDVASFVVKSTMTQLKQAAKHNPRFAERLTKEELEKLS